MNKNLTIAGAALLTLASMTAQAGGDYAAGEKKAKVCGACHGADGNSPSGAFPKLAGQWESYIKAALHQYKSGQRKNAIMAPQAQNLSEQDILDVAAFYSQQPPALHVLPR